MEHDMTQDWITAIGMMSGTSLDGVDAALIETDGVDVRRLDQSVFVPYAPELRERMRECFGNRSATNFEHVVADDLTQVHVDAVNILLAKAGMLPGDIGIIGFHGQTVFHEPASGLTRQIGTPHMLAEKPAFRWSPISVWPMLPRGRRCAPCPDLSCRPDEKCRGRNAGGGA